MKARLLCIVLALGALPFKARADVDARPIAHPDVVLIVLDDVSPLLLRRNGGPVRTPHLDRLAAAGTDFTNAHAAAPLCNPSRAALLTGVRPAHAGIWSNADDWRALLGVRDSFPRHMQRRGYATVRIGKIEHRAFPDDAAWTRILDTGERPRGLGPARRPARDGDRHLRWGATPLAPEDQEDGRAALRAAAFLREQHDEPFLLAIGLDAPHLPFRAPARFHAAYPPDQVVLPAVPADDLADTPIKAPHPDHLRLTEAEWREVRAAHYATISYADWCVGKVLDAIEDSGRADRTIVVAWSDHGFMLGEHGLWRKRELFEEATRTLLTFRAPGVTQPGSVVDRPVEAFDLFPTVLELAALPPLEGVEAISMVPLLVDPTRAWKPGALSVRRAGKQRAASLRTARYRLTVYDEPRFEELYDHELDPHEFTNVASLPGYGAVRAELERLLMSGGSLLRPPP